MSIQPTILDAAVVDTTAVETSEPDGDPAQTGGCEIALQNPCRYPQAGARDVRPWLTAAVAALAPRVASFAVRFVSDREMRRLNRDFRHRDRPTDVLSFVGEAGLGGHLGDVAISVPTAMRRAQRGGYPLARELRVLMLHGLLHCLGYDHETDSGEMERLERAWRRRLIDDV